MFSFRKRKLKKVKVSYAHFPFTIYLQGSLLGIVRFLVSVSILWKPSVKFLFFVSNKKSYAFEPDEQYLEICPCSQGCVKETRLLSGVVDTSDNT